MADPMEWFAMDDPISGGAAVAVTPVMEELAFNSVLYGQVVGISGPVVWTPVWEPLSESDYQPTTWPNVGPLAVGHVPSAPGGGGDPATYVPTNDKAVAVGLFTGFGILRLRATAGGVPVPGELVMTIVDGGTMAYPDVSLSYSTGTPPTSAFWTEHQSTYEIP